MLAEFTKFIIWMASPLGVWLVLMALACAGVLGRRRLRSVALFVAQFQLLLFSLPVVADRLLGGLESEGAQLQAAHPLPAHVDAIVVLGGGLDGAYPGVRDLPDLNDSADRLWVGARVYAQGVAGRVVVSGGSFGADPQKQPEAPGMAALLQALGVPQNAIVQEAKSRTTLENAQYTHALLGLPQPRVALVTSAFHMGRAVALFRQAGFEVHPVVADIRVIPEQRDAWEHLPKPQALDESTMAIKEYLGRLQLGLRGLYEVKP
ncbi:YdcF family protein [Limnobacter sp.]|uniref:YdcF family protein n=1 Tax=Limnobacter sp. TaxID=2003368 RepID=UPI0035181D4A